MVFNSKMLETIINIHHCDISNVSAMVTEYMQEFGEIILLKWRFHWYFLNNLHLIVIGA